MNKCIGLKFYQSSNITAIDIHAHFLVQLLQIKIEQN